MKFIPEQVLIDTDGSFVVVKSISTLKDKETLEIINQTIEVYGTSRIYKPIELREPTGEEYVEYLKSIENE